MEAFEPDERKGGISLAAQTLKYKGRPLVRSGNTLYYGSMGDEYVALLQIRSTAPARGMDMANSVTVQLLSTDESISPAERIVRRADKNGLYEALNIADIWLTRLTGKQED